MKVHAHAARTAAELLLHLQDLQFAQIPAAVLGRKREAIQIVLASQIEETLRKDVGLLDFLLHFLERALRKRSDLGKELSKLLIADLCIWFMRMPLSMYIFRT